MPSHRGTSKGFTLVELVITTIIISMISAWALPNFTRRIRQGEVDRYTQTIETGLFSLRNQLGITRHNCTLHFPSRNRYQSPWNLLELQQPNGSAAPDKRISCSGSSLGEEIDNLNGLPASYRAIQREGTPESNAVEVAVSTNSFELSPPGMSVDTGELTIRIRSLSQNNSDTQSQNRSRLITRCIKMSGTGFIMSGNWDDQNNQCISRQKQTS